MTDRLCLWLCNYYDYISRSRFVGKYPPIFPRQSHNARKFGLCIDRHLKAAAAAALRWKNKIVFLEFFYSRFCGLANKRLGPAETIKPNEILTSAHKKYS